MNTNTSSVSTATAASDGGRSINSIGIVSFERKWDTATTIRATLTEEFSTVDLIEYDGDVFERHWGEYDCLLGLMASGIVMRKSANLLADASAPSQPIVVTDEELTWAIPILGGEDGANQVATALEQMGAVPAVTSGSVTNRNDAQSTALKSHVDSETEMTATQLDIRTDASSIIAPEGPAVVLVDDETAVTTTNTTTAILGVAAADTATPEIIDTAWTTILADHDTVTIDDVAVIATLDPTDALTTAAKEMGLAVACVDADPPAVDADAVTDAEVAVTQLDTSIESITTTAMTTTTATSETQTMNGDTAVTVALAIISEDAQ
jgi:cobalt-precorrin 5A hydrolase